MVVIPLFVFEDLNIVRNSKGNFVSRQQTTLAKRILPALRAARLSNTARLPAVV